MYELPDKVKRLTPYEPVKGIMPVRLDANESFIETPQWLRVEISEAVQNVAFNRYPDPDCTALCWAFANYFGVRHEGVVAGNGSDELISLIVGYLANAGDTLVVVLPDFSMYEFYAQMAGVNVEKFQKPDDTLDIDIDALIAFAREKKAKMLVLSNPCNPTSRSASARDIKKLTQQLPDCLVVADEAYMEFDGADNSILKSAFELENLIVLKTCSKAFGMAAIRLGFAVSNATLTRALKSVKSPYNVNSMTQEAGCIILSHGEYLQECTEKIRAARVDLYEAVQELAATRPQIKRVYNTCTNFVFVKLDDPRGVYEKLKQRGIAVRCLDGFLRISAGSVTENSALLNALAEILEGAQ